jgi:hypothetical protein
MDFMPCVLRGQPHTCVYTADYERHGIIIDALVNHPQPDPYAAESAITSPTNGQIISTCSFTIQGNAHDYYSGVSLVEVSTDNGATWHVAQGTTNWSYQWNIGAPGVYMIKSRATDAAGNVEVSNSTVTVTTTGNCSCAPGADYLLTSSTGASIVPGTTQVPGSSCNSCTVNIPLPFSYDFYGTMYNSVTASNKGVLQFSGNSSSGANACLPTATLNNAIMAYWDDLNTLINDNMGIYTSVTGTAPNRVFNIEWRAGQLANDTTFNFEVRLYEGQPKFEVIYGLVHQRGHSATIGVQEGTGTRFTQHSCNTQSINQGTMLTFDRRACSLGE